MSWFTSKKEKFVEVRSSFFRKLDDKKASTESAPVTEKDLQIPGAAPSSSLTKSRHTRTPPLMRTFIRALVASKRNNFYY